MHVQSLQAQKERSPAVENEDDLLSADGTASSEEEANMEMNVTSGSEKLVERMDDMKASLEAMQATQNAIATKLASLEKVVLGMQVDTTWVREDLGVVHEVVEKLAEYVADLSKPAAGTEGEQGLSSPSPSPWGPWNELVRAEESERPDTTILVDEERVHLGEEEPSHIQRGGEYLNTIEETQLFDMNVGMDTSIGGLLEGGGGGGWYEKRSTLQTVLSPTGKQARMRNEEEAVDEGLQETTMTLDETQACTQTAGRSMWEEFRTAVRDVPSSADVTGERDVGSVRSKRGRGSNRVSREGDRARACEPGRGVHGNLNLNLSPDGVGGGGENIEMNERGMATRGRPRGSGRGTGRVRRPPAVQPRYMSTACSRFTCVFGRREVILDVVSVIGLVCNEL